MQLSSLAEHFKSLLHQPGLTNALPFGPDKEDALCTFTPVTSAEVRTLLKNLVTDKAAGPDGIRPKDSKRMIHFEAIMYVDSDKHKNEDNIYIFFSTTAMRTLLPVICVYKVGISPILRSTNTSLPRSRYFQRPPCNSSVCRKSHIL